MSEELCDRVGLENPNHPKKVTASDSDALTHESPWRLQASLRYLFSDRLGPTPSGIIAS
jgi:hypothetical protein